MIQWVKKNKKTCKYLNYVEHLFIIAWKVAYCVSSSAFVFLLLLRTPR